MKKVFATVVKDQTPSILVRCGGICSYFGQLYIHYIRFVLAHAAVYCSELQKRSVRRSHVLLAINHKY